MQVSVDALWGGLDTLLQTKPKPRAPDARPDPARSPALRMATASAHAPTLPPVRTATAVARAVAEEAEPEPAVAEPGRDETLANPFDGIPLDFSSTLQQILDEVGLNSEAEVARLASLRSDSAELRALAKQLAVSLDRTLDEMLDLLRQWQTGHATLAEVKRKAAVKTQRTGLVPIWRCGVCGRADMPYIACYVQPYIVRYDRKVLQ